MDVIVANTTYIPTTVWVYYPIFVAILVVSIAFLILSHFTKNSPVLWGALSFLFALGSVGAVFTVSNITYISMMNQTSGNIEVIQTIMPLTNIWLILVILGYMILTAINIVWLWSNLATEELSEHVKKETGDKLDIYQR